MFKTIVLAIDGSESSDLAVAAAADLARESGGRIVAVHIKEMIAGRFAGPAHVDENDLQAKIRGQVKELADSGLDITLEMHSTMTGGPAPAVAETAAREQRGCHRRGHPRAHRPRRRDRRQRGPAPVARRALSGPRGPDRARPARPHLRACRAGHSRLTVVIVLLDAGRSDNRGLTPVVAAA